MKVHIFSARKALKVLVPLLILIIAAVFVITSSASSVSTNNSARLLPIYYVQKSEDEKLVSISFDAAWGNEDTEKLIEILGKYNVKATFFVVGAWVDKYPESVKALSEAGHEIGSHSNTHPHMASLSREQIAEEINKTDEKIKNVTGRKPTLFRAPYGEYCNTLIEELTATGHYCIQWDVDSLDWKEIPATEINKRVLSGVKPGSIVLFHNAAIHTPEALPGIIEKLQGDGYTFKKISDLILKDNYDIDANGMQKPKETAAQTTKKPSDNTESENKKKIG